MTGMILAVGLEAIGHGIGVEDRDLWQVQVGVTRVGAGGRVMPRCRNGRMTTPDSLVASTFEPQEIVNLPRPTRKAAPLARAVTCLMVIVVTRIEAALRGLAALISIVRSIWSALVPPQRFVSKRARQAWESARKMGIALPSLWHVAHA
jgi:hypothetical protein